MTPIRVYPVPPVLLGNPYLELLYGPMSPAARTGIEVRAVRPLARGLAEVTLGRGPRIMHLHFFDAICQRPNRAETRLRTLAWLDLLRLLRMRGVQLVWTVHNLEPHDNPHPDLAATLYRAVNRLADAVIAHSQAAAGQFTARYGRPARLAIIPHGHYIGRYGPPIDQAASRARLGIPHNAILFLSLGQLRRDKQLDLLIQAFCRLDHPSAHLLVAGSGKDADYVRDLRERMRGCPRIRLVDRFIPDAEMPIFLSAADAAVIPYAGLTSGALITAMSYGLPVIAPDTGPYRELVHQGQTGLLFPTGDADGLRASLEKMIALPERKMLGRVAFQAIQALDWQEVAARTMAVYTAVMRQEEM